MTPRRRAGSNQSGGIVAATLCGRLWVSFRRQMMSAMTAAFPGSGRRVRVTESQCDQYCGGRAGLCPVASHVNLLGYRQSIIDLDAEVANRALDFVVAQRTRVIMHILLTH
jgi:hypothetical protein